MYLWQATVHLSKWVLGALMEVGQKGPDWAYVLLLALTECGEG